LIFRHAADDFAMPFFFSLMITPIFLCWLCFLIFFRHSRFAMALISLLFHATDAFAFAMISALMA